MTGRGKFVAVVAGIMILVMPAAAMPFRCALMSSSGESAHHCQMMGMNSPATQLKASPGDLSCCQGSDARPETIIVPRGSGDNGVVVPQTVAFMSDLSIANAGREMFDHRVQSSGGPPLAVLCTFLI